MNKPRANANAAAVAMKRQQQRGNGSNVSADDCYTCTSLTLKSIAQSAKRKRGQEDDETKIERSASDGGGSAAVESAKPLC